MDEVRRVIITTVPPKSQKYPTCDDFEYFPDTKTLNVKIGEMKDWRMGLVLGIHALVEAAMLLSKGKELSITDKWDLLHLDSDDPGEILSCPYGKEHAAACVHERLFALGLDVHWESYTDECERIFEAARLAYAARNESS
jgi:hypothetical protein